MTKEINIFNKTKRSIKCITNEFDYLGDGEMFFEERLPFKDSDVHSLIDSIKEVTCYQSFSSLSCRKKNQAPTDAYNPENRAHVKFARTRI